MIQKVGQNCSGCGLCAEVCPRNAIAMKANDEGFLYPQVNEAICVECGLCKSACPVLKPAEESDAYAVFAVKHKDDAVRRGSTSGGLFTAVSDVVLNRGGVVYGAAFTNGWLAEHKRAENAEDRDAMRGSKYIQSNLGQIYALLETDLQEGRTVVFSGTPCQCAAISKFVKVKSLNDEHLVLLEVLCTGVNSPKLWQDYCELRARRNKIEQIEFRSKVNGWKEETIRIRTGYDDYKASYKRDPFCLCFSGSLAMRESCHRCIFAKKQRCADISMGDFWAYSKLPESFVDDKGISMVLINTDKGKYLFEQINNIERLESDWDTAVSRQAPLRKPVWKNPHRAEFWECYKEKGLELALRRFTEYGFVCRWKSRLRKLLKTKLVRKKRGK